MTFNFLITRPEHDDTTFYLSNWSKETIKLAEEKEANISDLHREKANKKEFEERIFKYCPEFIVLNGHGDENSVAGHKNQELISIKSRDEILRLNIIYAISCRSAKNLGKKCIEKGTKCYIGYDDDFIFVYEKEKISRPLFDETAKLFLEPSKVFIETIIKNNSVKEALERSKKKIQENFVKTLSGNEQDTALARYLWWNLRNFKFHGDDNAKVAD
jgi:dihydroxyacetone kinase-like predicted kinase